MDSSDRFVEHSLRTSMFFPETRLMVAGNPKAAGTTLRWWLLTAHGVDVPDRTRDSWWGESAPYQVVWDDHMHLEYIWPQLTDEQRQDALESDDVLTVRPVRNPITRAFSAWSGKYLTGEPYYEDRLAAEFRRLPDTFADAEHVAECFEQFTTALRQVVTDRGFEAVDVHFWPQSRLLARAPGGESLTLRQEAMRDGLDQVSAHLKAHGLEAGPAPRINETVVPYRNDLVSDQALATVVALYEADLSEYDYSAERPESSSRPLSIEWLNDVRGRNSRYGVLHRALMHERHERDRAARELDAAQRRESDLVESTSWKVTAPLRWAKDRTNR